MTLRFPVRLYRRATPFLLLGLLGGCASTAPVKPTGEVNALYTQLNQASKDYETAAKQAREGQLDASQATLTAALDSLKDGAVRCGNTPGCDTQRFFSTFDHLLRLKDGDFTGPNDVDSDIDPARAALAAGGRATTILPQAQRSVTLLRGEKLSELIAMNAQVKASLEMWLTQWRPQLVDAYVNYQYMRSEMWPAYEKSGLPEAILFGIMAKESGGRVHSVSRSGAAGPLQFMYATGMRFGLGNNNGFDTRYDPAASARANAEYINEQLRIFNNNLELTLAAYNGGEGRMKRIVGDDTSVSFYDPRIYGQLSQETREYVPYVLAAAWLFLHPESYNLKFPQVDAAPGSVILKQPASLAELSVCLGNTPAMPGGWFRTLRNLNAQLDHKAAQPAGKRIALPKVLEKAYASRCVDGPWTILAQDLHAAVMAKSVTAPMVPAAKVVKGSRNYKVRRGDTLISIVRGIRCSSVQELAEMNGLKHHHLSIGQTLKVPVCR